MDSSMLMITVVAMLAFAMETESCLCERKSLRQYYCDADFAVRATVSNWTMYMTDDSPFPRSSYVLQIRKVYKMPSTLQNETEITVHSSASDGMCGINPGRFDKRNSKSARYFITGSMTDSGMLTSRLCMNVYKSWKFLEPPEKVEIKRLRNYTC